MKIYAVKIIELIKKYFFDLKLKKKFLLAEHYRHKNLLPPQKINTILIIFDATDESKCKEIFDIVADLQNQKKEVRALGYVPYKEMPHYCLPKLSYDYLSKKHINFFDIPTASFINDIIKMNFNLLINFMLHNIRPIEYVAALSKAQIKIGNPHLQLKEYEIYDIVIMRKNDDNNEFYKNIFHYLPLLKTK